MAILSSLFGAQQQQPAVGAQPKTTTEIPTELKPYNTDILSKAKPLYNKRVEEGFKPYEGPTIAQFTPEQEATFAGIAGLQGQVAPKFAEAEQLTRDAAAQITGAQLQADQQAAQTAAYEPYGRLSQYGTGITGLAGGMAPMQYQAPQAQSPWASALSTALGIGGLYGQIYNKRV